MQGDDYYADRRVAERYDAEVGGDFQGDRDFYLDLARRAHARGESVLELAVGTGRVAIYIAGGGVPVLGLDRSPVMLEVARRKTRGLDNVELVEGDMADFDLGRSFGLVYIPARSFLLLTTVERQMACLRCVRDHLVPGGRLALNIFNPDIRLMAAWMGPARKGVQPDREIKIAGGGSVIEWETRRYLTSRQEIDETRIEECIGAADGAVISRVYRKMGLRYVFCFEMQHLLECSGFEVEAVYGGFHGEPFADESTEMVWVARKPFEVSDGDV